MRNILLAAFCTIAADATVLNILNDSFEYTVPGVLDPRGIGSNLVPGSIPTGGTLADWTAYGDMNTDRIGALSLYAGGINWSSAWHHSVNIAYVRSFDAAPGGPPSGLEQTISDTLQLNTTYTLSALIGRPTTDLSPFNYSIELWAGTTQLGSASNLSLAPDSSALDSLTVVIGAFHSEQNQNLRVRLQTNGPVSDGFFDLVSGTATPNGPDTPEPASFALLGAGLVLLAALRRN